MSETASAVLTPEEIERVSELARGELQRGEIDEAISILEEITLRAPSSARAHLRLGIALRKRAHLLEARQAFRRAVELQPDLADAHHGLGSVVSAIGNVEQALEHFLRAAQLAPENAAVHNDLGGAFVAVRRADEAMAAFERAAALRTDWGVPWHNMAILAFRLGERTRAMELLRRATASPAVPAAAHLELGMHLLRDGDYAEGWKEYEWRWPNGGKPAWRDDLVVPVWDGSPLGERTLLLWHEQGYGDVLQFVRFVAQIPKEQGKIVLYGPERLRSILATCRGVDHVVIDGDKVDIDVQFPLVSLPNLLGIVPAPVEPYLSAPAECADADEAIERGTACNVGIVWASGRLYPNHAARDCPLALFAELASIPGVRLYSLQYGEAAAELEDCAAPIVDLSPVLGDFHKTAAFLKRLDLVISVDTSLPHLAGALGVPVWTLICHEPDWRWAREGSSTPWYGSMRLYRQQTPGDWKPVMERIAHDLRELTAGRYATPPPAPRRTIAHKPAASAPRIFIKQYGEVRTGTNYLRAALLANYEDVEVLIHILGDKHAPPVRFEQLREESARYADPAWVFVATATFGAPAALTQPSNPDQLVEVQRLSKRVTEAYDNGELRYLISVKDPYAWAVSHARSERWIVGQMPLPPAFAQPLARACRRFNSVYSAWAALADAHPGSARVVRYEDVLSDPAAVFAEIEKQFGLRRRSPRWQGIAADVLPAYWDGWKVATSERLFDRAQYLERRYLERIPDEHRRIIATTIDWPLMARFGYAPLA